MSSFGAARSYACYGCVDFANNARTKAYYQWACAQGKFPEGGVPKLDLCDCDVDDEGYTDPITDNACWYDADIPESEDFLGVIILNISGLRASTFQREVIDGFLGGSVLQRPRIRGKGFGFEVLLLATSCEGMNYGEEWLRSVLEDTGCRAPSLCATCAGRTMAIRVHCSEDAVADDGLHVWHSAGLVDGLAPVDDIRLRQSCCVVKKYTFTMQSESPYSFSETGTPICDATAESSYVRCFDWLNDCKDCPVECCDRCTFDTACGCEEPTPLTPVLQSNSCFCTPLARAISSCCVNNLPGGYDSALKIDIFSGSDWSNAHFQSCGLRNLAIELYDNPMGLPCITDDESYADWCLRARPCAELLIDYVPSDSVLTIDGRTERITVTCDNVCRPYGHVVSAVEGSIFPLVTRCQPLMVVAKFDYYNSQLEPVADGIVPSSVSVSSYLRFRN